MQLWYGTYSFPVNAAEVTSATRTVFSNTGRPIRYVATIDVVVPIDGSGQSDLSRKENALRAALMIPYKDLILKTDSGAPSSAGLINRNSITGVRLKSGPDFKEAQGAEFVNRRTASFSMEAEYVIRGAENAVIAWTESITITGNGGPDRVWRFPVNAAAIRQEKTPTSLVIMTQSGSAVGHTRRPVKPQPIYPDLVVNPQQMDGSDSPEPKGLAYLNWPIKWSYTMQAGFPLVGFPSLPPMP